MVLDSKALEWASAQGLDTATLKKAKVPVYGKWYFPELPANEPLVNLQTGAVETFGPGFRAGAVLYVKEEDLRRAKLGPYKVAPAAEAPAPAAAAPAPAAPAAAAPAPAAPAPAAEAAQAQAAEARAAEAEASATERPPSVFTADRPVLDQPTTDRSLGTESVEAAAAVAPVQPSASPTMPAVGEQTPVRMLEHADETGHAEPITTGRAVTHGVAADGTVDGHATAHAATLEHAHPTPQVYIVVALILAVITAIEVATYYIPGIPPLTFTIILLVLSVLKFVAVVGWFMHLKFDHKLLVTIFAGCMAIAVSIVLALIVLFMAAPLGGGH